TDICGPITPTTYGGNRYFISFIDDFTRKSWIYIIKSKDQAIEKLKELYKLLKNHYNIRIKNVISDGRGEYTNESFKQFLSKKGITHCITPPYTPQRNGVAERFNRTIIEKVRCMIKTKNLEKELWGEAANTANQIRNYSPTAKKEKSPEEEFTGIKPDLSKIKIFGSKVMIKNKKDSTKLEDKAKEGLMLGYNEINRSYRVWDIKRKKVTFTRDISIYETTKVSNNKIEKQKKTKDESSSSSSTDNQLKIKTIENNESDTLSESDSTENKKEIRAKLKEDQNQDIVIPVDRYWPEKENKVITRKSTREHKKPETFGKVKMYNAERTEIPNTY